MRLVLTKIMRAARLALAQQADQQRHLLLHGREVDQLAHLVDGHLVRLDAHQLRIVHVLVGELEHAMGQRGGEQHATGAGRAAAGAAGCSGYPR